MTAVVAAACVVAVVCGAPSVATPVLTREEGPMVRTERAIFALG
jgi:hypothetical protein